MPCFYCGKRVSLVRQMSDADFCSDEHRKRYHALTRLAFNRLLETEHEPVKPESRPAARTKKRAHQHEPAAPTVKAPAAAPPPPSLAPVTITEYQSHTFEEAPAANNGHGPAEPRVIERPVAGQPFIEPPVAERPFPAKFPDAVNAASTLELSAIGCGRSAPRPALPRVPAYARVAGLARPKLLSGSHPARNRQCARREVGAFPMRGSLRLPVCRFVPAGEFTAEADPALCETWMTVPPRTVAFGSTRRSCAALEFHASAAGMPQFAPRAQNSGLPRADLKFFGYPAATRPHSAAFSGFADTGTEIRVAEVRFPRLDGAVARGGLGERPLCEVPLPGARKLAHGEKLWAPAIPISELSTPLALRVPQALAGKGTAGQPSLSARPCLWQEVPPRPIHGPGAPVHAAAEAAFALSGAALPEFKTAEAPGTDGRSRLLEGRSFEQFPAPAPRDLALHRGPRAASAVAPQGAPTAVEIPSTAFFAAGQGLPAASAASTPAGRAFDLAPVRAAAGWVAYAATEPELGSLASRTWEPRWAAAANDLFLDALQRAAHPVAPRNAGSTAAIGFSVPEIRHPETATYTVALGEMRPAALPVPEIRLGAKAAASKGRLTPAFRLSSRPSRFPVFRAKVEKAHMPHGAFCQVEIEDRADERTVAPAPACAEVAPEPAWPRADFGLEAFETLEPAPELPVAAGPYAGAPVAAAGEGEQPYTPELFFVVAGIKLLGMDFEGILETYEPRWRNALKTASGLFRGVMVFIPAIVVLSGMLTGCSANGSSLNSGLQKRAAIRVEHDFSSGLDGWYGGRNWAQSWLREPGSGYIRAGQLALYRPSQPLTNYRLEFLGQIQGESIGWAFRAADLQNYYATKLIVVRHGPSPEMALVRYQVVAGQETGRVQVPLRKLMHNGRPYRIQQDVDGNGFRTSIEDEVVDFWTDDRLRTGGVGFFGQNGDTPHLYWVRVTYQDDFWGKICAAIAPNN